MTINFIIHYQRSNHCDSLAVKRNIQHLHSTLNSICSNMRKCFGFSKTIINTYNVYPMYQCMFERWTMNVKHVVDVGVSIDSVAQCAQAHEWRLYLMLLMLIRERWMIYNILCYIKRSAISSCNPVCHDECMQQVQCVVCVWLKVSVHNQSLVLRSTHCRRHTEKIYWNFICRCDLSHRCALCTLNGQSTIA